MSGVHASPLAHGQEMRQRSTLQQDVNRHLPFKASVQQISEDVHISEDIHHHGYDLQEGNRPTWMI